MKKNLLVLSLAFMLLIALFQTSCMNEPETYSSSSYSSSRSYSTPSYETYYMSEYSNFKDIYSDAKIIVKKPENSNFIWGSNALILGPTNIKVKTDGSGVVTNYGTLENSRLYAVFSFNSKNTNSTSFTIENVSEKTVIWLAYSEAHILQNTTTKKIYKYLKGGNKHTSIIRVISPGYYIKITDDNGKLLINDDNSALALVKNTPIGVNIELKRTDFEGKAALHVGEKEVYLYFIFTYDIN